MSKLKRVLIMAGGTGGHVYPGLAFAHYLRTHNISVEWLGTRAGIEASAVPKAGIPLHLITIEGVRGGGFYAWGLLPFKLLIAIWQAIKVLCRVQPTLVIGMGGFVSGPGGIASILMRYPLVIHEQNAKVGLTNRLLSFFSKKNCGGFPTSFKPAPRTVVLGNPVRDEIERLAPPSVRFKRAQPFRILVLGGSRGARAINRLVPEALSKMTPLRRPLVLHQTGSKLFEETKNIYQSFGLECDLKPFIDDMASAYAAADLVICRAGALTIAELCAAGVGAIFIPYPYAVDDHQTANAEIMVQAKAALCYKESDLSSEALAALLEAFASAPERCFAMAEAAYRLRQPDVVQNMYHLCVEIVN